MSNYNGSNGHADHEPPGLEPVKPLIALEYRLDDGRTEVCRVDPEEGGLTLENGAWWLTGADVATGYRRHFRLTDIVMFFGLPVERPASSRCLCGAIEPEDCGCESEARKAREGKGAARP